VAAPVFTSHAPAFWPHARWPGFRCHFGDQHRVRDPMGGDEEQPIQHGVVRAEEALRYAMSLPVATTICGIDSLEVWRQNLGAVFLRLFRFAQYRFFRCETALRSSATMNFRPGVWGDSHLPGAWPRTGDGSHQMGSLSTEDLESSLDFSRTTVALCSVHLNGEDKN
jgi:hypothetical protein